MGYKIAITDSAERDLDAILTYISQTLSNKDAAVSFLSDVEVCYDNLERMPLMYEQCQAGL